MRYLHAVLFGLKRLYWQPKLCVPVVASLGLTLAAALVVLTLGYSILFKPLPHINQAEQLSVQQVDLQFGRFNVNFIDKHRFVSLQRYFANYGDWGFFSTKKEDNVLLNDKKISASLFTTSNNLPELLGVPLLLGAAPAAATEQQVWISESLWHSYFAADTHIIGKALEIQQKHYTIAGVLPDFYAVPDSHQLVAEQIWQFFEPQLTAAQSTDATFGSNATIILRSTQQPTAAAIQQWLDEEKTQAPATMAPMFQMATFSISQQSYRQLILGDSQKLLSLLLLVTLGLFIIASLNLTNVLLAHYNSRQHEFAVQRFAGCSNSTLRVLVALENLSLLVPAAILGLLAAQWLIRLLPTLAGSALPMTQSITLNSSSLICVILLCGMLLWLFSLPVNIKDAALSSVLSQSGKGNTQQQKSLLIKSVLVIQLGISSILITSTAALAWQSYLQLYTGWGFTMVNSYEIQLTPKQMQENLRNTQLSMPDQQLSLQLQTALQQNWPDALVLQSKSQPISASLAISKLRPADSTNAIDHTFSIIDNQHFTAFDITLLHGRHFNADEDPNAVIIDLNFASLLQPGAPANALGQQLVSENASFNVVGIAANVKTSRTAIPHRYSPTTFTGYTQPWQSHVMILPPGNTLTETSVSAALAELAEPYDIKLNAMRDSWLRLTQQSRIYFYLICIISATTLLLAMLGTAGVSQMRAQQRRYELAVRMATGASQQRLLWLLGKESGILVLGAITLSALVTTLLYQQVQRQFSQLPEFNISVFVCLNLLLLSIALLTLLLPSWRAIKQDPIKILRSF